MTEPKPPSAAGDTVDITDGFGATALGVAAYRAAETVVSERIGHADVGFYIQTYAHVLGNDDHEAAEQAATFLLGNMWDRGEEARQLDDEQG